MAAAALGPDLRRFVVAKIHSVPMLEALLLLRTRAQGWTVGELAQRLYLPEAKVDELLQALQAEELSVTEDGVARYAPASPAVAVIVDRLAETYSRRVVEVAELIHSRLERQARNFADAFVLRRDE